MNVNLHPVVPMQDYDKKKIADAMANYLTVSVQQNVLNNNIQKQRGVLNQARNELEEAQNQRANLQSDLIGINQNIKVIEEQRLNEKRKMINKTLSQIFGTNEQTIHTTIPQSERDKISYIREKKCLGIDDETMQNVILAFAKMHGSEKVNLTPFKDEFKGTSLVRFLSELPQTQVKTVIIAKQLTQQELEYKNWLEYSLANRGFTITIKS